MNSEIHFQNVTKLNNVSLNEYIFQHRGVNYKNTLGTFKEHPIYNVPTRLYRVSGTPRVHFIKQYGRLKPELDMDDSIRVSLLPTEIVEEGQLAITFIPAEVKVVSQVREAGYRESHTAPGSFSEPKINLTLSRLETGVGIPRSQGLNVRNANESAFSDISQSSESAAFTHESLDLSTTGYLERLEEVAKTFPKEVNKHLEKVDSTDFTLLSLKLKKNLMNL